MKRLSFILIVILTVFVLAACDSVAGDPSETVVNYLQAKVEGDRETLSGLLCADMEADLEREVSSFASVVDARLENAECTREGDSNVVSCTGSIVANYGQEDTEFPLSRYNVVQEDGEWKWCGVAG